MARRGHERLLKPVGSDHLSQSDGTKKVGVLSMWWSKGVKVRQPIQNVKIDSCQGWQRPIEIRCSLRSERCL